MPFIFLALSAISALLLPSPAEHSAENFVTREPVSPGAPAVVTTALNPGARFERSACVTSGAGPAAAFQCGELLLAHSMPAFTLMNTPRSLTLLYTSGTAKPFPIVMADVSIPSAVDVPPDSMRVTLIIDSLSIVRYYSTTGFTSGGAARRISVGFDAPSLKTGLYRYTLKVANIYSTGTFETTAEGDIYVVNRVSSAYGAGWSVAGVERIVSDQAGRHAWVIIGADGSGKAYELISGTTWVAGAGAQRDTLRYGVRVDPNGTSTEYYWRRTLDGDTLLYNPSGKLRFSEDAYGNSVEYQYLDALDPESTLSSIIIKPAASAYTYAYSFAYTTGGLLDRITDPSGRVLDVTISNGNLTQAFDPGFSSTVITFAYAFGTHLLTGRTNRRSNTTSYSYHAPTPLLASSTYPSTGGWQYTPTRFQAFAAVPAGNLTAPSADVVEIVNGPRGDVDDRAYFFVNGFLAPTKIIDPIGGITLIGYDTLYPLLPARVKRPDNNVTKIRYDLTGIGRPMAVTDSFVTGVRDSTTYQYDNATFTAAPSVITSQRDSVNRDSNYFVYNAQGSPEFVTDARLYQTRLFWNGRGQLDSLRNTTANETTRFAYDSTSPAFVMDTTSAVSAPLYPTYNTASVRMPSGRETTYSYDNYGNVSRVVTPAEAVTTIHANARFNTPDSIAVRDSVWTVSTLIYPRLVRRFSYDSNGNLLTFTDPRGVQRHWRYDVLDRPDRETDEFGAYEQRFYDPAGNLGILIKRDGASVLTTFDAMNRDTLRELNSAANHGAANDTVRTSYDIMGRPLRTENSSALVERSYSGEGRLASETQTYKWKTGWYSRMVIRTTATVRAAPWR